MVWPTQATTLALGREKGAAAPSACPPPRHPLTFPQPALHPPFHPGLLHGLSALPEHQTLTTIPQWFLHAPVPTNPKAPLCLRRTNISGPWHLSPTIAAPFPSRVFWGAGGWGDGTGAGGALWGPGDKAAAPRCSLKSSHGDSNPGPPHLSGKRLKQDLALCRQTTRLFTSFLPHPPTSPFLFSPGTLWLWLVLPDKPAERASYPFPQDQQQLRPSAGSRSHGSRCRVPEDSQPRSLSTSVCRAAAAPGRCCRISRRPRQRAAAPALPLSFHFPLRRERG